MSKRNKINQGNNTLIGGNIRMKEVKITLSLLVNENYLQKDADEIVSDIKGIIAMTDSEDIRYEYGMAEII